MANKSVGGTIIKIAVASLLVGLLLSFFNTKPQELLGMLGETAKSIFKWLASMLEGSIEYILLGAAVVIPIYLVVLAWRMLRGKN